MTTAATIERVTRCTVADLGARHVQKRVRVYPADYYDEGMPCDGPAIAYREGTLHAVNAMETDDDSAVVVTLIFQDVRTLWDLPLDTPCDLLDVEEPAPAAPARKGRRALAAVRTYPASVPCPGQLDLFDELAGRNG